MRTAVVEKRERATLAPDQDHFIRSQSSEQPVTRLANLTLVTDVKPGSTKDSLLFGSKHRWVGVHRAVHPLLSGKGCEIRTGGWHKASSRAKAIAVRFRACDT